MEQTVAGLRVTVQNVRLASDNTQRDLKSAVYVMEVKSVELEQL